MGKKKKDVFLVCLILEDSSIQGVINISSN